MTDYSSLGPPGDQVSYLAGTFGITSFVNQDGSATITQGSLLTISGTATPTQLGDQPGYDENFNFTAEPAIFAGNPVSILARSVAADGSYGPATLLGTTTLVDTNTKDQNGQEIFSWSLANIDTSSLPAGIYDIEASEIVPTETENLPAVELADHPGFAYLTIAPAGTPDTPPPQTLGGLSAEISRDGRYVVTFANYDMTGAASETDLQTGKVTALASGQAPPVGVFAPGQGLPLAYANNQYTYLGVSEYIPGTSTTTNQEAYDTYHFTSANGDYTFGAIGQDQPYNVPEDVGSYFYAIDSRPYYQEIYTGLPGDLYPVVTNVTTGITTILPGFGGVDSGIPTGASDTGDVVLTENFELVTGNLGPIHVSYLSPAPSLTIDPVNGVNQLYDYAGDPQVTIAGTSSAIGKSVEIDVAAVSSATVASEYGTGQMIGLATVQDNGTWSLTFDPNALGVTPSAQGLFFEASVSSADGTPARTGVNVAALLTPPTAPTLFFLNPQSNQTSVEIQGSVSTDEQDSTILIYDNFNGVNTLVGTTTQESSYNIDVTVKGLAEGVHQFTAVDEGPGGVLSAPSNVVTETVDLTPPSEKVVSATVNGGLPISLAQQKAGVPIAVHGELDQPLAADDYILIDTGNGLEGATVSADGKSFDATIGDSGVSGALTISVSDAAGNLSPGFTVSFEAASLRTLTRISATPADPNASYGYAPVLSGDGGLVAFLSAGEPSGANQGAYVAQVATGKTVAFFPGAQQLSLSADGSTLSYVTLTSTGANELFVVNLGDPSLTPLLIASTPPGFSINQPSLSGDGTQLVFDSSASTLAGVTVASGGYSNVFLASANGVGGYNVRALTSDATGSAGDAVISTDGTTVAFNSDAADLPGANSSANAQTYIEALTGLGAGQIVLVDDATTDGMPANFGASTPSLSRDGSYIVFASASTNLAPVNLGAGQTLNGIQQIYLKDLHSGRLTLLSVNALGAPADESCQQPVISADGTKVVFESYADNLGPAGDGDNQIFVADLATGTMTLVTQAGGVEGFGQSGDPSITANGAAVAFDSYAPNLVADDTNSSLDVFVTSTTPTGQGEDGYIVGAQVGYLDSHAAAGVVQIATDQPQTTTSAAGDFTLGAATDPTLPIVLTGGVDSATGLAFNAYLEAPAGSTVVTALTTLIEKTIEKTGDSPAAAQALVATALRLPAGVDLTGLDAFGGALRGAAAATTALEIAAQALNLVELIVAAGGSATNAFNAIAAAIVAAAPGTTLSLIDAATVTSLAEGAGLSEALAQTVANIVAAGAAALAGALTSAATPQEIVVDVTADSIAQQGTGAAALASGATFDAATAFAAATTTAQNHISALDTGAVACFVRGARIALRQGEAAVETLAVGDLVRTASGRLRPVVWLGHRRIDTTRHPDPASVWPVVVRADAFGPGLPRRDLGLSPGHNLACDGRLMAVGALVNGVSVEQVAAAHVEYWHVELDAHDVVLAEGLPTESYLDTGNRSAFANGGAFIEAHPDFASKHWSDTCLPLVQTGPEVAAVKQRLLGRLAEQGHRLDQDDDSHVVVDGLRVEPIRLGKTRLAFVLPPGGREIALRSNVFVPAQTIAESDDVRKLGLCVGRLQIDGAALGLDDDARASGWHEAEFASGRFSHRWTTGATSLPAGARVVILDLIGSGHYRARPERQFVQAPRLRIGSV